MIKGWSDVIRFQRLGTISLGIKNPDGSPKAVDYFVVPPEVAQVYGEKPRELDIMFPSDDLEVIMPWYMKRYGQQVGLICRGDNETAALKYTYALGPGQKEYGLIIDNGKVIHKETGEQLFVFESMGKLWIRIPCTRNCRFRKNGSCRPVGLVNVLLPKVPGALGVYTIATSSWNSCANLHGALKMLLDGAGRIRFVETKLKVKMQEAHPELKDGKSVKTVVPVLMLDLGPWTLEDLVMARLKGGGKMLPPAAPVGIIDNDDFEEKTPELLFPGSRDQKELPRALANSSKEQEVPESPNREIGTNAAEPEVPFNPDDNPDDIEEMPPLDAEEVVNVSSEPVSAPELESGATEPQTTAQAARTVSNNPQTVEERRSNKTTASRSQPSGRRAPTDNSAPASPAPNQMEFTAARPAEKMKARGGAGDIAWVRAQCTFGLLQGKVVDVWAEPNSQAVGKIEGIMPGMVFAAVPKRVVGSSQVVVDDIQVVAASAEAVVS